MPFTRRRPVLVPRVPIEPDATNEFTRSLIGLVYCGDGVPVDLINGRILTADLKAGIAPIGLMPYNARIRPCSTTKGVYTARKAWANWEPTSPFSFFALFYLTAYAGSTAVDMGNSSGGDGFRIGEQFGTGNRAYGVGATANLVSGGTWPLNQPIFAGLTYDGTTLRGYFNGVADGSQANASPTYGSFDRVFAGHNPDTGSLTGGVAFLGLCNQVISAQAFAMAAADPIALLFPDRGLPWWMAQAGAGNTYNDGVAESGSAADTPAATAVFVGAISEAGSAADTIGSAWTTSAAQAETGAAADTVAASQIALGAIAEAGTAADTTAATATLQGAIAEAGSAADTVDATKVSGGVDAIAESGSAADTTAASAMFAAAQAETGSATDTTSATAVEQGAIVEAGSAVDTTNGTVVAGGVSAIAETGNAIDSCDAHVVYAGSIAEGTASATDLVSAAALWKVAIAEAGAAVDTWSGLSALDLSYVDASDVIASRLSNEHIDSTAQSETVTSKAQTDITGG